MRMTKTLAAALALILPLLVSCDNSGDEANIPETQMNVLFIGNSFLVDASEFLPVMLHTAGIKTVRMDRMYHGGYTLEGYNTNYDNKTIGGWMSYRPGYASWKGDNSPVHSVREIVESAEWDCVLFNDGASAGDIPDQKQVDVINELLGKIAAHQPGHPVKFYFVNTQPDAHGYSTLVNDYGGDQLAQFRAKCIKAITLKDYCPFEDVISTGAMIQNLRTSRLNVDPEGQDLSRDGHHLDYGISRYGAACTVFEKIFTPVYKVDIKNIKVRTEWACRHPNLYCTAVTSQNAPIVIKAAKAAVAKPYEVTNLSAEAPGAAADDYVEVMDDVMPVKFPVVFPVGYSGGKGLVTSDTQSRLRSDGVWECHDQRQAYMRINWGRRFADEPAYPYVNYLASDSKVSSPEFFGLWDGDNLEFVLPVKDFPAGTTLHFYAPFYHRQGPVFWNLEYFDEGQWKCDDLKENSLYGHTCICNLPLGVGTSYIDRDITFAGAVESGFIRIRLKVVDGRMQGNSQTSPYSIIERDAPYMSSGKYAAPVYFHTGNAEQRNAVVISLQAP